MYNIVYTQHNQLPVDCLPSAKYVHPRETTHQSTLVFMCIGVVFIRSVAKVAFISFVQDQLRSH